MVGYLFRPTLDMAYQFEIGQQGSIWKLHQPLPYRLHLNPNNLHTQSR